MIRIGANPIGWTNDDLQQIGGDTPLETCLAEAREAGVVGMEKGHKMPNDGAALKAKLAEFGHVFVGGWYSTELLRRSVADEVEAAKPHVAMTKGAGAERHHPRRDLQRHPRRPRQAAVRAPASDQGRVGRRSAASSPSFPRASPTRALKPCYHHHMGTVVQSEADIDSLMAYTKAPLHLLLDTGHARWGGADPAGLARTYRERIGHVHCKDVRERQMRQSHAGDWSFLDSILGMGDDLGVYTAPGDGMVDYAAVFRELPGYSGWVVLEAEQDPKKAPSLPYAKKGIAHLKAKLAEAGLS